MLGYTYKDLSHIEKLQRRHALDAVGRNTVLSQLMILVLAYIYRLLFCTRGRRGQAGFLRRLEWRLMMPLSWDSPDSRSIADWVVSSSWFFLMLWLVVRGAGDDYLYLTKAFGMAAAANFPLHILLSMKRTPFRYLFDVSYNGKTNYMHQGLGKIIYLLLSIHSMLYLKFFWDTNRVKTRLLEFDILCGITGFILLSLLLMASYHWVRKHFYNVFYVSHITLSPAMFLLFYLHVNHLRPYILVSVVFLLYDRILCSFKIVQTTATIHHLPNNILHFSINLPKARLNPAPASHLLLHIPTISTRFTKNPFTIADSSPEKIHVVARVRSGLTKKLAELVSTTTDGGFELSVKIDMYYGACISYTSLSRQFDKILLIAGGVGGAFAIPWVKHLAHEGALEKATFVWVVRDTTAVTWAVNPVDGNKEQRKIVAGKVELFITGPPAKTKEESGEGVEMQERLLGGHEQGKDDAVSELSKLGITKDRIYFHRPDLEMLLEDTVDRGKSAAVLVCGPWGLGADMKRAVGKRVLRGDRMWIHVEEFGN